MVYSRPGRICFSDDSNCTRNPCLRPNANVTWKPEPYPMPAPEPYPMPARTSTGEEKADKIERIAMKAQAKQHQGKYFGRYR